MNDITLAFEVITKIFSGMFLNAGFLIVFGVFVLGTLAYKKLN